MTLKNISHPHAIEKKESDYISSVQSSIKSQNSSVGASKRIEIISWKANIIKYGDWWQYGTEDLARWITRAANDPSVSAIIIDMDSGGGSAGAVELPTKAIENAKQIKPVIGYAGNGIVASAAYWILSACNEIYTTFESDQVGSIGVYRTMMNIEKVYSSWLQTDVENLYSTTSEDKNKGYRMWVENSKEGGAWIIKNDVDPYKTAFENTVKANRPNVLESALKGAMYRSEEALKMGLIDGIKTFEEVIDRAFELSDNYESNNKNTNMGIFGKSKVETLIAAGADARTAEMFVDANTELNESGLEIVNAGTSANATKLQSDLDAANKANGDLNASLNAVATAAGLKVSEGKFLNAEDKEVSLAEAVASLVSENTTLREKAADLSTSTTQVKSEGPVAEEDPEVAAMNAAIDKKL